MAGPRGVFSLNFSSRHFTGVRGHSRGTFKIQHFRWQGETASSTGPVLFFITQIYIACIHCFLFLVMGVCLGPMYYNPSFAVCGRTRRVVILTGQGFFPRAAIGPLAILRTIKKI